MNAANIGLQQCKRKRRQNVGAFRALIAAPAASFIMPANADLAVQGAFAGGVVITVEGASTRAINSPALSAGQMYKIGWFEKGSTITVSAGVLLFLDTGLGVYKQIGAG